MDKDRSTFENYKPLQGNERKKDKLYKKMVVLNESGNLPEKSQRAFAKFLTPVVVLALFFIMIPFFVNNELSTGNKPKVEDNKVTTDITKRDDWFYGEGEHWKGYINVRSAEAWRKEKVKKNEAVNEYDAWSESIGELTFTGEHPEKIKYIKYEVDKKNGHSGGTEKFDRPFQGTVSMGYGGGNSYTREDEVINVTVEWDGKKEVIPFIHDRNKSTSKKIKRTKSVSAVEPFEKESNQFLPPKFLVAGDENFQLGASTWDPLMLQMENVDPSLEQWNGSQNVLLMFQNLTTITDELTIKGKHESGTEEILYKAPIYQNAVEGFKGYDWVIPANLPFKKDGVWTLTAYEGDKKVGAVTIDVQRTDISRMTTPLYNKKDGLVRNLYVGIDSHINNIGGKTSIYMGKDNVQKVFWKFFEVRPENVIIQGIHESGRYSFSKVLDQVYMSDADNEYEVVDTLKLDKEGYWSIRFYSNKQFLGEIVLIAEHVK